MSATIVLTDDQAAGIGELIALAERGREDFLYQAGFGDYTEEENAEATERWEAAQAAAHALHQQIETEASTTGAWL